MYSDFAGDAMRPAWGGVRTDELDAPPVGAGGSLNDLLGHLLVLRHRVRPARGGGATRGERVGRGAGGPGQLRRDGRRAAGRQLLREQVHGTA